ncbi:MAG: MAE_28990/MAE_18760 family HEPN-like nuclease [Chitinophagaceae bacterium]
MNLDQIWAEVEEDLQWRTEEIRFLHNQIADLDNVDSKDQLRRATVLMLYAHFEGFCKFVFLTYIKTINEESLFCKDVNFALAASAMSKIFDEMRQPDKKSELFRNSLPNEGKLHRFARDREFIETMQRFEMTQVVIPDSIADTESNLKPIVLSKILFYLGFEHDAFKVIDGDIHTLLNIRNKIAHGVERGGVTEQIYNRVYASTFRIMREIKSIIMESLSTSGFLRTTA